MPASVQKWLTEHPQYLEDAVAQAELNLATMKAVRAGKTWHDSDFLDAVERYLGLNETRPNGNGYSHAESRPLTAPRPVPHNPPRQQYGGVPVSAPPTRNPPSFSTGRPQTAQAPLSQAEREIAQASGISESEYQMQKAKMQKLKAAGVISDFK